MPRRKITEAEIDDAQERGRARLAYLAHHPEERGRADAAAAAQSYKRSQKSLKKHQPVVTDISGNGECISVEFVRNNGERVIAHYRLNGWGRPPAGWFNRRDEARLARVRAADEAAKQLLPDPAGTPRS
jgi:hypothetical protein